MKTLKQLIALCAVSAILSTGLFAQSQDVEVSANILAQLTLTATDIVLGDVQYNTAATLDPEDVNNDVNVGLGSSTITRGVLAITTGSNGAIVDVTCTNATLSDGTETLAFTTNAILTGGSSFNCDGTTTNEVTLDGSGEANILIGGTLAASTTTGSFNTTNSLGVGITIGVDYQ